MPDTHSEMRVRTKPKWRQLFGSVCADLEARGKDLPSRLNEIAGLHAADKKPKQSRKLPGLSEDGHARYGVVIFTIRFRYWVEENALVIYEISPPPWD